MNQNKKDEDKLWRRRTQKKGQIQFMFFALMNRKKMVSPLDLTLFQDSVYK